MGKSDMTGHRDITREVRCDQDRALAAREETRPPVAARVLALRAARIADKRRRRRVVWGSVAGAFALAAGVVLFVRVRPTDAIAAVPLSFTVDARGGATGTTVVSILKPVVVQFSDGSEIDVASLSSMRVAAVERWGAVVVLERGTVSTHVVPRTGNRWSIAAGPYRVQRQQLVVIEWLERQRLVVIEWLERQRLVVIEWLERQQHVRLERQQHVRRRWLAPRRRLLHARLRG
jgi:hypothetical protein